ncbi:type II secretion system F family protein [Vibrio sp. SCSIO 43136]|uniref:type II secretion system F family protein n=1 Tax=Vibrio sp. SCSIO 43136 TaxID=2819101 RepID=UPI002075157B|nr:type II secretion system F family protein [Vibrio sp. SCSIO 43136]USD64855.1 type II secretion system F family protein [Vibrio sp. SCSIO 43136]
MVREKQKMRSFRWQGINSAGKKVSGECLCFSEHEVRIQLSEQKIQLRKLRKKNLSSFSQLSHRVKAKDIMLFTRQMATMLATGISLVQALDLIADSHHKAEMKNLLRKLRRAVEAGTPISKAMRTSSPFFDSFYVDMLKTGEQTGNLSKAFERLAEYLEKSAQLKAKVIKAMIYPAMVMLAAIGVTYLMLTMVIPEFEKMFTNMNATLPWFTEKILTLSHWVQSYGAYLLLGLIITILGTKKACQQWSDFHHGLSKLSFRLPIFGDVMIKASIAKFARTLATSFTAGVPILTGLQSSARTANNPVFYRALQQVHQETAAGTPFYLAIRHCGAFPKLVEQMVMIGETSGQLDDMLNKVANLYEDQVDDTVDNLGKLLEPLIIMVLGGLVGGLVVAMYLPIFNLMNVLG